MTLTDTTPRDLQLPVMLVFHAVTHADRATIRDVLRSLEQPAMPEHVSARIENVLKEIRDGN